jgi:hypothetical protein
MSEVKIIEKEFAILQVDKKNKNHRNYPTSVVNVWVENELNHSEDLNQGFDLEYAIDDEEEERDIYNEFTMGSLSCGIVNRLQLINNVLYATVRFKLPQSCGNLTENFYEDESILNTIAIVPKGKGSVRNQTVQDDYELFGFNLIKVEDSSFVEEEEIENTAH